MQEADTAHLPKVATPDAPSPRSYTGIRRLLAGLMMGGGGLFALFCGIVVTVLSIQEPDWALVVIFVGAFAIVPGAGIAIVGWSLWRR